ncbi:MAG: C1 family peptidase [Dactylosporangium sp.]|nr:C1 family peptidase [Dactylosporangium sp.]NNJ62510.1 C1 family peptidase [Dactylosporangium sp.]
MTLPAPRPRKIQQYGWVPDLPDQRDHLYSAPQPTLADLPPSVDLRKNCPKEVYSQGALGSCTANAIAAAFEYHQIRQKLINFMPSRLFVYYNERVMSGTVDYDSGAMIRDGIKTVAQQGVCPETSWPYDISRYAEMPPQHCYQEGLRSRAIAYQRITRSLKQLKGCIAQGLPIIFGFQVYESFEGDEVAETGMLPLPGSGEHPLGGHAVLAVGYDDAAGRFLVRNSWGGAWGMGGYFTMPYGYLTEHGLSADFWAIIEVS